MKPIRLSDVLELPVAERLKLVEAVWDSIAEAPEVLDLTEAQRSELDRRLDEYEKNPEVGVALARSEGTDSEEEVSLRLIVRPDAEADMATGYDGQQLKSHPVG